MNEDVDMKKQTRKMQKLLETLDELAIFLNHDKHVIRMIANYGKRCRHVKSDQTLERSFQVFQEFGDEFYQKRCKCRKCIDLPDEKTNPQCCVYCRAVLQGCIFKKSDMVSFTIDQYDRLWIVFENSCELDVYDLTGRFLFRHIIIPNIPSAKLNPINSIRAVGDQLVICRFYPPKVLILALAPTPTTIKQIISFNAESRNNSQLQNWLSWSSWSSWLSSSFTGGEKNIPEYDYHSLISQAETATICRQTKTIVVAFRYELRESLTMEFPFCVYSQTGVFLRIFKIQTPIDHYNRVFFDNNEDQILIINGNTVFFYDFYGNKIHYEWDDNSAFFINNSHPEIPLLSKTFVVTRNRHEIFMKRRDDDAFNCVN